MRSALRHYQAFPQIVAKMIEVAESTGRLTEVLGMLLEFYQFQQKMILEQKRLLNYPLVVFSIFIVLSLGAVIFMVPMFKRMYAGLGEDLFWLTRALVKLSDSLRFNPEAWILGTLVFRNNNCFCLQIVWMVLALESDSRWKSPSAKRTDAVLQS